MDTSDPGNSQHRTADRPRPRSVSPTGSDRALILGAFEQADRAAGSDHPGADEHAPPPDLPAGLFPGYELRREIHRGGQGVVYKATQLSTKQTVALKLMHNRTAIGTAGRARFEREVHVLGQLDHPGIVNVLDSGTTSDGGLFYVMDYVGGKPLDAILREWRARAERIRSGSSTSRASSRTSALGSTELRDRLMLFAKVCEGVNAAHLKGVIHRDLKPANIRLDSRGEPVVVDFGLAKVSSGEGSSFDAREMTTTGQFIGSMPWSSPEQAEGAHDAVDTRSDVYSLGVVLYQIITGGRFPYVVVGTMREVMHNIVHTEPERPSLIDRGINDEVETIVLKALAKERERRYQTAGELARDVRRYLAGEPIEAKRDSGLYLLRKALRRHRVTAGFIAAMVVLTLGFTATLAAKYAEANGLRIKAVSEATAARLAEQNAENERERAEANFDAVRDLAHTFMFGFSDEIEHLAGATSARAMVVAKAAEYLARLQRQIDAEPTPRPALLADLAGAYDRLADLQAAFAEANLGESDEAGANYERAQNILAGLLADDPGNGMLWLGAARNAMARARFQQTNGQFDDAIATALDGLADLDRAVEFGARALDVGREKAACWVILGDLHQRLGRAADNSKSAGEWIARALSWYDRADAWWQVAPADLDREARLARAELLKLRSRSIGERANWSRRDAGDPGDEKYDDAERDAQEELRLATESAAMYEALRNGDPADRDAQRGLVTARMEIGQAAESLAQIRKQAGRPEAEVNDGLSESLAACQSAYAAAQSLARDLPDLDAQRLLGLAMNKVGNALRSLGRLDESELLYSEMVAHREGIVRTDPTPMHRRDLALAQGKLAQIAQFRGRQQEGEARAASYREALHGFLAALSGFRSLDADGVPMAREIEQTERVIRSLQAELGETP
ncbi:MAG: serine/threonine protein kinase [Phycisphaeraceae bacterium]|nr:MAG: serine/threonine protein kinase [Phycisphaeraceae bacterium]